MEKLPEKVFQAPVVGSANNGRITHTPQYTNRPRKPYYPSTGQTSKYTHFPLLSPWHEVPLFVDMLGIITNGLPQILGNKKYVVIKLERPRVQYSDSQIPPPSIISSNRNRWGFKAEAVVVGVVVVFSCDLRQQFEVLKDTIGLETATDFTGSTGRDVTSLFVYASDIACALLLQQVVLVS
jgi:hypothetical protein